MKIPGAFVLQGAAWVTAAILDTHVIQAVDELLGQEEAGTALTLVIAAAVILGAPTLIAKALTHNATHRDEKRA